MTRSTGRPLEGVLVVALEHAVAVPFATRQLADLGARVVKIERPGTGDFARHYDAVVAGQSSHFVWLNRGKESIELDLKDRADREVLDALIARADVVVANLAPGAVERLGLDAATVRATRTDLIHCTVSGYGTGGPYGGRKAYDLLVQCETGLVSVTGTPQEPARTGVSIADIATGMYTLTAILAALLERVRTGAGATLEIAMIDALGEWMTQPALFAASTGRPLARTGARHPSISPYGPYQCRDACVFVAVQNDREWAVLCREVLHRPDAVDDPRFRCNPDRVTHRDDVDALLESVLGGIDAAEAETRLGAAGIATARIRGAEDLLSHPQLLARDRWREVAIPGGASAPALLPPVTFADGADPQMAAVPALGEHNSAIRAELGLPARERAGREARKDRLRREAGPRGMTTG